MTAILLVDDNEMVRQSLGLYLSTHDDFCLLGEAANGWEAVIFCSGQRPDIILMDINMPVMDGIEATKIIRQRWPEIRILAITSFGDNGTAQKMLDVGAESCFQKNSSIDELTQTIHKVMQHKRANKSIEKAI
jgi:DNA-binding NarL/FixJ family response regulator